VLLNAVQGISDLITIPGLINVDFADVRTIMSHMGRALMGTGRAQGERRAIEAAQQAINSPLLEDVCITGATGILINITGGPDLTLFEVNEASTLIQEAAHEEANIIFGSVIDANLVDEVRITVIATGFDVAQAQLLAEPGATREVERKRATQIAMPYLRPPSLPPPPQHHMHAPAHAQPHAVVEKTQAALREQPIRPDQTPITQRNEAAARATPQSLPAVQGSRLQAALSGAEETELDIPAFLRRAPSTTVLE
jgi:cell division protein FtsZ